MADCYQQVSQAVTQAINQLVPIVLKCFNLLTLEIASDFNHINDLDDHFQMLIEKANEMYKIRDAVVDAEKRCVPIQPPNNQREEWFRKKIRRENWIVKVNGIEKEVFELEVIHEKDMYQWFSLMSKSSLSEMIKKKCDDVDFCIRDSSTFLSEALDDRRVVRVIRIEVPNRENLPLSCGILDDILQHLKNKKVKKIGLYGKKKGEKTRILQNLNNSEEVDQLFDLVIFGTLTGNKDEELLQREIAQRLKLNTDGTPDQIAFSIAKELESRRYLLILDEVWETFSLVEIGIPANDKDSKVVLACKPRGICVKMNVDELINV